MAYTYNADIYCDECIEDVLPREFPDNDDELPAWFDDHAEADSPMHCSVCGEFLENPLTSEGERYVRESIRQFDADGRGNADVITAWRQRYAYMFDEDGDLTGLNPQLIGLEGYRVQVTTTYGETRRFIVGRSTGWKPCHLEIARRNCHGSVQAEDHYALVRPLYRAWKATPY